MLINPKYSKYEDWQSKREIKQGIQDLTPFLIKYPTPPPIEEFINFGLPYNKQFFVREHIPDWVYRLKKVKRPEALAMMKTNHYMAEWIDSQWRKRDEGVYMFIKGQPFHIPGKMWFYLNYYMQNTESSGTSLADFRYGDLEWFWIWCLFVLPNPNIYGMIELTCRRDGKSAKAMCECLEELTKTPKVKGGLQSKTDKDGRDTFQEFFVEAWRELPIFFSPLFDNKTYPAKEINFRSPSVSGQEIDTSLLAELTSQELGSSMEVRATVKNAFDGRKLRRYIMDEAGKIEEMNAYEAWATHKECLRIGQKMVGKALITSTVEMLNKYGLGPYFQIWDESDHAKDKLTSLYQTKSGLVRLFKPGYEGFIYDQWGFPIIDRPDEEIAEYRKQVLIKDNFVEQVQDKLYYLGGRELIEIEAAALTGKARQDFLRKHPPSIAVARRAGDSECAFPAQIDIIDDRLDELKYGLDDCYVGNLKWVDNLQFGKVEWVPCQHKRRDGKSYGYECPSCMFRFFTMDFLPYTNTNYRDENGYLCPGNKGKGLISADTFKYDVTKNGEGSKAASHGYMEFDLTIDQGRDHKDQVTDDFVYEFVYRTRTVKAFSEEMAKVALWLGWEVFPEINLPNVWNDFVEWGLQKFLKFPKALKMKEGRYVVEESSTPGIVTLGEQSKLPTFAAVEEYLNRCGYKCKAFRFLQDCRVVEFAKLTKYDAFVSGSQNLYGRTPLRRYVPPTSKKPTGLDGMITARRAGT